MTFAEGVAEHHSDERAFLRLELRCFFHERLGRVMVAAHVAKQITGAEFETRWNLWAALWRRGFSR